MSLRAKLLLLSLLTLILPWAGWQYAEQMESSLRQGQEQALLTTAEVLSRVVASQPEELYRVPEFRRQFDVTQGDLFAPLLSTQPLLDGFPDEWPVPSRDVPGVRPLERNARLGVLGRFMYLYVEVNDDNIRYAHPQDEEGSAPREEPDRVVFLTRDEFDRERAWSVQAMAPGPVVVKTTEVGAPWGSLSESVPQVVGVWRETATGYAVELRAPMSIFGTQLAIFPLGANESEATPALGRLHTGSEALRQRLQQYSPDGLRVFVVDTRGWLLARAGSVTTEARNDYRGLQEDENGFLRSVYRSLLGRRGEPAHPYGLPYGMWGTPVDSARAGKRSAIWFEQGGGEPSLVRAAVPIESNDEVLGAVIVEEAGEELVLIREVALTRLLNLTLVATLFSIVVTLVFAVRLSHRIRRLSRAAGTALTPEGRIEVTIPETRSRDELGALARSYSALLGRVQEYTSYLQTLGTKLSHELRTPLTIVSSSLDNLASDNTLDPAALDYLERARTGVNRLHAILTAMTEATRVEQSIEHTDRVEFDVAALVRDMGLAYSQSFPAHAIETHTPADPCTISGSPELIAQLLDKLMDNAIDFSSPGTAVTLSLTATARNCTLTVSNQGPLLPMQLDGRLFESLVSARTGATDKPHLGLGLFIVRLIAEFHHGHAEARNLPDQSGVMVSVELPLWRIS
ncbi:MAG: ATP-binding protein [Steroidobacteraceae bacterium]